MDSPIRGQTRELTHKVEATVPMNIHNRFDVEVIDSRTGKLRQRAQAENVICSQLWMRLFTPADYFSYIHYGTGSGTPAAANTSLFTFLGYGTPSTSDDVVATDYANCVFSLRRKIQLSETTAAGSTLTEVGIGYSTSSSTLCTHAMLKDANGNQISIAKTNTDIINIYATIFVHWPSTLNTGSIMQIAASRFIYYLAGMYDASTYCRIAPAYAQFCSNRDTHYDPSGTTYVSISTAYSLGAKTITLTCARLAVAKGNISGGIWDVVLFNRVNASYCFYPCITLKSGSGWYAGTNVVAETIGTGDGSSTNFATAFDCPSSATIYVDGVAVSATVDNVPLSNNNMGKYFEAITVRSAVAYPSAVESGLNNFGLYNGTYYNPFYEQGINSYTVNSAMTVEVSDNLLTWTTLSTTSGAKTVSAPYVNYKYWRFTSVSSSYYVSAMTSSALTGKNIHFTTVPASGAAITGDYHTPVIAKDENHVFDLSVTIQLGEYTS